MILIIIYIILILVSLDIQMFIIFCLTNEIFRKRR